MKCETHRPSRQFALVDALFSAEGRNLQHQRCYNLLVRFSQSRHGFSPKSANRWLRTPHQFLGGKSRVSVSFSLFFSRTTPFSAKMSSVVIDVRLIRLHISRRAHRTPGLEFKSCSGSEIQCLFMSNAAERFGFP